VLAALFEATRRALFAVTPEKACGFFRHCGYGALRAQLVNDAL
jgi:hypothetical protein